MEQVKEAGRKSITTLDNSITIKLLTIHQLAQELITLFVSHYQLQQEAAAKIIKEYLIPFISHLKPELYVVLETPYIDKLYRDSYYIFYASKLTPHFRDTFRISFFDSAIKEGDFLDREIYEAKLKNLYLGFLIIRPTFPNIIGRTAISPKALKANNFLCCFTELNSTVLSNKFQARAFPHSSQDGHTITCAETTIWGIMEYFSNQYAEYKPVLPSLISNIIQRISFKRTFPSEGLTAEQVTYAIRELGFGAMIYSRKKHRTAFNSIVSIYVESGIPVIGVLKNAKGSIGHAVNIIGRSQDHVQDIIEKSSDEETKHGGAIIDFNKVDRKYVFMDDNFPPYQLGRLDYPCKDYFNDNEEKEKWEDVNLTHIIVPLYSKIYLDAARAKKNFIQAINSEGLGVEVSLKIKDTRVLKIFLASSRSFKEYISLDSQLPEIAKVLILATPMPKFVWLAEISKLESFKDGKCDGILIQDATEPGEYSGKKQTLMHSLILGIYESVIFRQNLGKFTTINNTFAGNFKSFTNNLKSYK